MTINKIDQKGFYSSDGGSPNSRLEISGTIAANGDAAFQTLGRKARYEAYLSTGSQAVSGDGVHFVYRVNGLHASASNGFSYWNNTEHYFQFTQEDLNKVFLIRTGGIASSSTGNPTVHVDFSTRGKVTTGSGEHHQNTALARQAFDFSVTRGVQYDHSHYNGIFLFSVSDEMAISGAQMYIATDGGQTVTIKSASLMLTEI